MVFYLSFFYFPLSAFSFGSDPFGASEIEVEFSPRGPNVEASAGNCGIGPFGKTGDAGRYEAHCSGLKSGEKCLAYLKQHVDDQGQIDKAGDRAKAIFCLRSILSKMAP